jgi:hypothetical protein
MINGYDKKHFGRFFSQPHLVTLVAPTGVSLLSTRQRDRVTQVQ